MSDLAFKYSALGREGQRTNGVLKAPSQEEAYRKLIAAGVRPLRLRKVRNRESIGGRVTLRDLQQFTHQFAVLMEARIPIVDGLYAIAEQENKEQLRIVVDDIGRQVGSGRSVTDALLPHEKVFGEVYIETIRAAEKTGNLAAVLASLSDMLDRQYEMRKNVRAALMYPACVISALVLAVAFLMIFAIPRFEAMFESRGIDLPLPTIIVIGFSNIIRGYWWLMIAGFVAGVFGIRRAWQVPEARERMDVLLHKVPYLNSILRSAAISRFAKVFGLSLRSGLGLIDAIELSGTASGRPLLQVDALKLRDQVNLGGRLSDVIITCHYFPTFTRRMLAAGEEAAELPRMCEVVARNYDREVEHLTKNLTTAIEPILIVGLAGVVLVVALAVFLPMWQMADLIG